MTDCNTGIIQMQYTINNIIQEQYKYIIGPSNTDPLSKI